MFELKWVFKNLKGTMGRYITSLILMALIASSVFVVPSISKYVVNNIVIGVEDPVTGELVRRVDMLIPMLLLWLGAVLLVRGLHLLRVYCCETSTQNMVRTIRLKLFSSLQEQEGEFYDRNSAGDIMTRLTGDLDLVRHTAAWIVPQIINTVVVLTTAMIFYFTISWQVTLCLMAVVPVIFWVSNMFRTKMRPLHMRNRERLSDLNGIAQENISANKVVRAFAREEYEKEKFGKANSDFLNANLETNKTWLSIWPIMEFLSQFLTVIVLVVGGIMAIRGRLSIGDLSALMSLVWAIANSVRNIGTLFNDFQRFFPSADKIIEIYYARPAIVSREDAVVPEGRLKGEVVFENVSLKLRDKTIVSDISFCLPAGKTLGIVGETGSGKTTLINLLARFYDATEGRVTVDGIDVRNYNLQALRRNIGVTTQDVFLFSDTIEGNVAFGRPDLPMDKVYDYAKRAAADEFITAMPEGYDTIIGERGVGLSGGQRQRIALARALAVEPSILILDDTTSAVDMKTERYIWEQLQQLPFECTKIVVAQRISTVAAADMILVMQEGRITQCGTHEQLVSQPGFYREVYELQSQQME
ncbi:MAG: ABC transporter ATP-binding protein [Clostridia bacterium]|nr:ABC transporter ATP-binding protein [Clostridia bacterium]